MVTIKQIAELCGVSRGTVDRVLNHRGNVKPDKEKLILDMAKKLNYQPNPAGKALTARRKHPVVGVLIASEGVRFFDDVLVSMRKAARQYEAYGLKVIWRSMRGFDTKEQCALIDELRPQIDALIINPVNAPAIVKKLNKLIDEGLFVVTVNNDIESVHRHCYVGSDYMNGGRTAGALLSMIGPKSLSTAVLLGSHAMLGHRQRLEGFLSVLRNHPNFHYLGAQETEDDDMVAYECTRTLLSEHPETNSIFVISAGAYGAARAVLASNRTDITMIVFDTIPSTIEMMRRRVIQAALYQHPHQQGRKSMQVAFDYLVNGIPPERSRYLMHNEIRILENAVGGTAKID